MNLIEEKIKSLDEIFDSFIDGYIQGNYIEGVCGWNGDDALMSPQSFGHTFRKEASKFGYTHEEYSGLANELEEWCQEHLAHLESKFR